MTALHDADIEAVVGPRLADGYADLLDDAATWVRGQELDGRVWAGGTVLDARQPRWACYVDVTRLDMSDGCECLFGQLAAHVTGRRCALGYWDVLSGMVEGLGNLAMDAAQAALCGFSTGVGAKTPMPFPTVVRVEVRRSLWKLLDLLWTRQIEQRRPPGTEPGTDRFDQMIDEVIGLSDGGRGGGGRDGRP